MKLIPDPVEDPARVRARGLGRAEWGAELRGLNDKRAILSGQKTRQQAVRAHTMDMPGTGPSEQINPPPQTIASEERSLLDLLQDTSAIIPGRQSAQQHVQLSPSCAAVGLSQSCQRRRRGAQLGTQVL